MATQHISKDENTSTDDKTKRREMKAKHDTPNISWDYLLHTPNLLFYFHKSTVAQNKTAPSPAGPNLGVITTTKGNETLTQGFETGNAMTFCWKKAFFTHFMVVGTHFLVP